MHVLFDGIGGLDAALFVDRLALGLFFVLSGYHKLFNQERHASVVATLKADGVPFLKVNQWFVPSVEFLGGIALLIGLLSVLASVGLIVICGVATCVDGLKRIGAWKPLDKGDYVDDVLYLPEVLYAVGLLIVVLAGPGSFSLDKIISGLL